MVQRGLSYKKLFKDYSQWCTVVCLNKIVTSVKWLAIIYSIIFVIMVGLFIFISVNVILKYLKYPSSTELTIGVQTQKFPLFSFCNENPMKRSIVDSDPAFAEISKMLKQFEQFELKTTTTDDYGISTSKMRMQRLNRARTMLRLMMHKISPVDRFRAGYAFTDIVTECTFMGRACSSVDFTPFLHPDYGVCYSFVADREITRPGAEQGLRMLMTVNQDSPRFSVFDFLPTTDSATIRAIVHFPEDYPDFTKNGFKLGASTQAMIAFSRVNNSRTNKPYGNCTAPGEEAANYYANYTYTFNSCQHSCLQRLAWEHCKCVDPLYRKAEEHSYCATSADMLCLLNLTSFTAAANSSDGRHVCHCLSPCVESSLKKIVTYGVYPSAKYKVAAGTQGQRGVLLDGQGGGRQGDGDEDSDDYDGTTTTTTKSAKSTTTAKPTTSTSPSTTTESPECKTDWLSDVLNMLSVGADAVACRAAYPKIYNNPKFTVIQGWPCKSEKRCKTCVMFGDPLQSDDSWPCWYDDYKYCDNLNHKGTLDMKCDQFFQLFDFIPTGVNQPNISNWDQGKLPSSSGCQDTWNMCWTNGPCKRNKSSTDLAELNANPLLDSTFLQSARIDGNTTPCILQKRALAAATTRFSDGSSGPVSGGSSYPGGGVRNKRAAGVSTTTTTEPTKNATVDKPGYGSCEYANTNFKGAAECIKWYRRNGLMFELYYETLQYQSYAQGPTYTLVSMLSDIAGHAGLWLGLSVVSIVEFVGLFFMLIATCFGGKKMVVGGEGDAIGEEVANRELHARKRTTQSIDSMDID